MEPPWHQGWGASARRGTCLQDILTSEPEAEIEQSGVAPPMLLGRQAMAPCRPRLAGVQDKENAMEKASTMHQPPRRVFACAAGKVMPLVREMLSISAGGGFRAEVGARGDEGVSVFLQAAVDFVMATGKLMDRDMPTAGNG